MSHRPGQRFGQDFLCDQSVIDRILSQVDPQPGQRPVEIGLGQGAAFGDRSRIADLRRTSIYPLEAFAKNRGGVSGGLPIRNRSLAYVDRQAGLGLFQDRDDLRLGESRLSHQCLLG